MGAITGKIENQVRTQFVAEDKSSRTLTRIRGQYKQFGQDAKRGFGMQAGFGAFQALTAGVRAIGGAIAGAVNEAKTFEDGLGIINTVAGFTEQELRATGRGIQEMAVKTGVATGDLTAAFYDLVSAGVDATKTMDVLEDATTLSIGALSTTAEAVDLLTTTLNAYGMEAEESARLTDVFARTVQLGKVTAAELGQSMSNVAPIAAATGVEIEEVAAAYATMTAQGIKAATSSTNLRQAIIGLIRPNAQLAAIQKELGESFADIVDEQGLVAAFETLRDAVDGDVGAMTKALGSAEALQAALALTGDNAARAGDNLDEMRKAAREGGVAAGMMAERTDTLAFQQRRFSAATQVLNQRIGEGMTGPLADFFEWVTDIIGPSEEAAGNLDAIAESMGVVLDEAGKADGGGELFLGQNALQDALKGADLLINFDKRLKETITTALASEEAMDKWGDALGLTRRQVTNLVLALSEQNGGIDNAMSIMDSYVTKEHHRALAVARSEGLMRRQTGAVRQLSQAQKIAAITADIYTASQEDLALVARRGGLSEIKKGIKDNEKGWKQAEKGPNKNKKAINLLEAEVEKWGRREAKWQRKGREDLAARATINKNNAQSELTSRQNVRQAMVSERKAMGSIKKMLEATNTKLDDLQTNAAEGFTVKADVSDIEHANTQIDHLFARLRTGGHFVVTGSVTATSTTDKGSRRHFAMGGLARSGETFEVGERGRETMTVVGGGAAITPMGQASQPINVYVDGRKLVSVMDERMGRDLAGQARAGYYRD